MGSSTQRTSRRSSVGVTSVILIVLGVLGACSGEDEDSAADTFAAAATTVAGQIGASDPASAETTAAAVEVGDVSLAGGGAPPTASPTALSPSPIGAALAIVASVAVEVPDVRRAVLDIPGVVEDHGGAIYDTNVAVGDPATASATITVKVPPTSLEPLIAGLGGIGELVGRTQQTEDVAAQISDTGARIETARASVERVRELLASATDLGAVVTIEAELTVRETALETLLANQRNLADRVSLATLTITVTAAPEPAPIARDDSRGLGEAFRSGWNAFVGIVHGVALAVAYTAPLLVVAAVGGIIAMVVRRRLRHRHRPATPDAVTS